MTQFDVTARIDLDESHWVPSLGRDPRRWTHIEFEKAIRFSYAILTEVVAVEPSQVFPRSEPHMDAFAERTWED